jgi:RHS repeat-associated protein
VAKVDPARTTLYHYDAVGRLISETNELGEKLRDYIYLGNQLAVVDTCVSAGQTGCAEWYQTDALGSAVARTNAAGDVVAQLDYQPWGEQWLVQGDGGDRQYNGRVYDPGTGFHDYGARMYWPQIGRFISADSVTGSPGSPATLNRYSYVLNNPYKYVDPSGRDPVQSRIWANPISYDYLQRSGLADGASVAYLSEHGLLRDAVASNGGQFQGMQQSEKNLLAVEQGALEVFPLLVGVGLSAIDPGAGAARPRVTSFHSVEDAFQNPQSLNGKTPAEVRSVRRRSIEVREDLGPGKNRQRFCPGRSSVEEQASGSYPVV